MNILETLKKQASEIPKTERQQRIVRSAIKLFAEQGFSNTSTKEIAQDAQVSEGIIFKYYGKKDTLLSAIILPFISEFAPQISQEAIREVAAVQPQSFEEFLRFILKNRIEFIEENKAIFQVLIKEIFYRDDLRKMLVSYFDELIPPLLNDSIEQFKKKGELKDLPTQTIVTLLLTCFFGFFISRFLLLEDYVISDEEIEQVISFVLKGISN